MVEVVADQLRAGWLSKSLILKSARGFPPKLSVVACRLTKEAIMDPNQVVTERRKTAKNVSVIDDQIEKTMADGVTIGIEMRHFPWDPAHLHQFLAFRLDQCQLLQMACRCFLQGSSFLDRTTPNRLHHLVIASDQVSVCDLAWIGHSRSYTRFTYSVSMVF
jgi:hypothetical protein